MAIVGYKDGCSPMKTTAQLVDEARQNLSRFDKDTSFYRLARELDITDQRMYRFTHGLEKLPDEILIKTKRYLPYRLEQMIVWNRIERAKSAEVVAALQALDKELSPEIVSAA